MTTATKTELREVFRAIKNDTEKYFDAAATTIAAIKSSDHAKFFFDMGSPDHSWNLISGELQDTATLLIDRLLPACASLADHARSSPLTGAEDIKDVKLAAKAMRAALALRSYTYREADVIHDEGTVLGFRPAEQFVDQAVAPEAAAESFRNNLSILASVLKLVEATGSDTLRATKSAGSEPAKYVAGTAFIMMWMDPQHPELTDVVDTVKSVFRSFGVRAVRADEIEHEGLITERILNEIRTAEFLVADLTGARPNVYYEVGYAHALGKRVILLRKSGTGLHFDLAGYNCPEYENLRDLREKLTGRLVSITNRNPSESTEI